MTNQTSMQYVVPCVDKLKHQNYLVVLKMFRYYCIWTFFSPFCGNKSFLLPNQYLGAGGIFFVSSKGFMVALEQFWVIARTTGSFSTSFSVLPVSCCILSAQLQCLCFPQVALFHLCMYVCEKLWNSLTISVLPCMYGTCKNGFS